MSSWTELRGTLVAKDKSSCDKLRDTLAYMQVDSFHWDQRIPYSIDVSCGERVPWLAGDLAQTALPYVSYGTVFMDTDDGEYRKIVFDEDKVDIFAGHMIYDDDIYAISRIEENDPVKRENKIREYLTGNDY